MGAVALGIVSMQSAFAQAEAKVENEKSLPWLSASLAVRGFYDDNIMAAPNKEINGDKTKMDSFGFQIAPSVGLKYENDSTLASLRYEYGYTYFGSHRNKKADQSHLVDALFSHNFNDNVNIKVSDSFAVAQEPGTLSDFGGQAFMTRAEGDNMRNFGEVLLGVKYYENLGFELGYRNGYWDFSNDDYAFFLNRIEHTPHLDLYYDIDDINRVFLGVQYNYSDYTSNQKRVLWGSMGAPLYDLTGNLATYGSNLYNREGGAAYAGYRLTLAQGLDWTTKVGAQYTSWENAGEYNDRLYFYGDGTPASLGLKKDDTTPFAETILSWMYMENSIAQLGVRHDVGASQWGAMSSEATTVYANVNHEFTPRLTAGLNGVYQHADYGRSPGSYVGNGMRDDYFSVGPCASYRITSLDCPVGTFVDLSYSYDNLRSSIENRGYERNRVFLGVRATY